MEHLSVCTQHTKSSLKMTLWCNDPPQSWYLWWHRIQFPLQLTATMVFLIILNHHADWSLCMGGRRERAAQLVAGSQPPTGALCMKSVGSRTLSSLTSKGDSINYISHRALRHQHRTADTVRGRMREGETRQGGRGQQERDNNQRMRRKEGKSSTE